MKVKELIAELQKLDQERDIWIFYDNGFAIFPPIPDGVAGKDDEYDDPGVKRGDYIINAY